MLGAYELKSITPYVKLSTSTRKHLNNTWIVTCPYQKSFLAHPQYVPLIRDGHASTYKQFKNTLPLLRERFFSHRRTIFWGQTHNNNRRAAASTLNGGGLGGFVTRATSNRQHRFILQKIPARVFHHRAADDVSQVYRKVTGVVICEVHTFNFCD